MDEIPAGMLVTSMTSKDYLDAVEQVEQPEKAIPKSAEQKIHYEFSLETTESNFRLLMYWVKSHGLHGSVRRSQIIEEENETGASDA